MDCYRFFDFITILKESIKLFGKNSKMMALVTTLSMISYSIFFFIFTASSSSFLLLLDMLVKESMIPISSTLISKTISDATGISFNFQKGFLPLYFIITFLSTTATVTVTSYSCSSGESTLTLKELTVSIVKSFTRPFVTAFYTTISVMGYESLALYLAIPLVASSLESSNLAARAAAIVYGIAACALYQYVCGGWILSLVVAVVEEDGGGIAAIGKSAEIIKGRKLDAFLLNVFVNFVYFVALVGWSVMMMHHGKVYGLVLVNLCCLVRVLTCVAYTVLYYRVKELGYGCEVELHGGNVEYAKLDVIPLVGS